MPLIKPQINYYYYLMIHNLISLNYDLVILYLLYPFLFNMFYLIDYSCLITIVINRFSEGYRKFLSSFFFIITSYYFQNKKLKPQV